MAAKPLTSEAIALAEKKMDMTLDDIIKMSKTNAMKPKRQRISHSGKKIVNNASQDNSFKVRRYMDTRSSLRQGTLTLRRSNFKVNQFPLGIEAARKAAFAPIRSRAFKQSRPFSVNKPRYCQSVIGILCLTELFGIELKRGGLSAISPSSQKLVLGCTLLNILNISFGLLQPEKIAPTWNRSCSESSCCFNLGNLLIHSILNLLAANLNWTSFCNWGSQADIGHAVLLPVFSVARVLMVPGPHGFAWLLEFFTWMVELKDICPKSGWFQFPGRAGAPTIQKNPVNGGGFTVKKPLQQINIGPKQNHQTLDSLFANMKEERKRVLSQQNNWSRRNGGNQPRVPWARGHLHN
ncbi:UNVERIFIED_CONTAM: hypothetical protein Sindi_1197100 [Sesamum indicum]